MIKYGESLTIVCPPVLLTGTRYLVTLWQGIHVLITILGRC
nr:MAG TPA: hypothetical protein [Caudoviricetes sp.]